MPRQIDRISRGFTIDLADSFWRRSKEQCRGIDNIMNKVKILFNRVAANSVRK